MDWQWNANGKRFKVLKPELTKKKRVDPIDIQMEVENAQYKSSSQNIRQRLDREISIYKQQIRDFNRECCTRKPST